MHVKIDHKISSSEHFSELVIIFFNLLNFSAELLDALLLSISTLTVMLVVESSWIGKRLKKTPGY